MPTLLMRLEAPMQSYGVFGRFGEKDTGKEPSKSAVVGIVCAALGIERNADLSLISACKLGIRVDREGIVRNDYHIAGKEGHYKASGSVNTKTAIPTNRLFLADASFLVGLESNDIDLLNNIQSALKHPKWQIFLGKKSFVPSLPVWIENGVLDSNLWDSLINFPFDRKYSRTKISSNKTKLRFVIDADSVNTEDSVMISTVMDIPLNFERRLFAERKTATFLIDVNLEDK